MNFKFDLHPCEVLTGNKDCIDKRFKDTYLTVFNHCLPIEKKMFNLSFKERGWDIILFTLNVTGPLNMYFYDGN